MMRTMSLLSGLTALLDALEQDLLAAPVNEVRDAQCETGRARQAASQEIRSLLNEAVTTSEDDHPEVPSPGTRLQSGIHRH